MRVRVRGQCSLLNGTLYPYSIRTNNDNGDTVHPYTKNITVRIIVYDSCVPLQTHTRQKFLHSLTHGKILRGFEQIVRILSSPRSLPWALLEAQCAVWGPHRSHPPRAIGKTTSALCCRMSWRSCRYLRMGYVLRIRVRGKKKANLRAPVKENGDHNNSCHHYFI